jgi:hypothetical protein
VFKPHPGVRAGGHVIGDPDTVVPSGRCPVCFHLSHGEGRIATTTVYCEGRNPPGTILGELAGFPMERPATNIGPVAGSSTAR